MEPQGPGPKDFIYTVPEHIKEMLLELGFLPTTNYGNRLDYYEKDLEYDGTILAVAHSDRVGLMVRSGPFNGGGSGVIVYANTFLPAYIARVVSAVESGWKLAAIERSSEWRLYTDWRQVENNIKHDVASALGGHFEAATEFEIEEAADPVKDFIIGDWGDAIQAVLELGYDQDLESEFNYSKRVNGFTINLDFQTHSFPSERVIMDITFRDSTGRTWALWESLVSHTKLPQTLEHVEVILASATAAVFAGNGNDINPKRSAIYKRLENLSILSLIEAKPPPSSTEFMFGDDWPVPGLVKRGYKEVPFSKLNVDVYEREYPTDNPKFVWRMRTSNSFEWSDSHRTEIRLYLVSLEHDEFYTQWSGRVENNRLLDTVDELESFTSGQEKSYIAISVHMRDWWNSQWNQIGHHIKETKELPDPKDYILGNDWLISELKSIGFKALNAPHYWYKDISAHRGREKGRIVVWIDSRFGKPVDVALYWRNQDGNYEHLATKLVDPKYAGRVTRVLITVFSLMRVYKQGAHDAQTLFIHHGHAALGAEYEQALKWPLVGESVDAKVFIEQESPFWEFKLKMEELGWHYLGIKRTPRPARASELAALKTPRGFNSVAYTDLYAFERVFDPGWQANHGAVQLEAYVLVYSNPNGYTLAAHGGGSAVWFGEYEPSEDYEGDNPDPVQVEKSWDINEIIQPDSMSPVDFAELVDDEFAASKP